MELGKVWQVSSLRSELEAPGESLEGAADWTVQALGLKGGEELGVGRGSPIPHPSASAPLISHSASQQGALHTHEPPPEVTTYLVGAGGKGCSIV